MLWTGQFQNHPSPPPPGKPRGIWLFLKNFGQIPRYVASLDGQMPHPLGMLKQLCKTYFPCVKPFWQMYIFST